MRERVTVGYDGSTHAEHAIEWAAHEAEVRGASLRVVTSYALPVADVVAGWPATASGAAIHDAARSMNDSIRDRMVADHPSLRLEPEVVPGTPSQALADPERPADVIVVGASGHRGHLAFWLGSTARSLVRTSACPVVVIRDVAAAPRRVLVGADGSDASLHAVRWAASEAQWHGVDLVVLHSWVYPYPGTGTTLAQGREITEIDAACELEAAIAIARAECNVDVRGVLVEAGPVTAILASTLPGDLVVVGSRGRGAIAAGLFGSTANGLLERSLVPVAVIPD